MIRYDITESDLLARIDRQRSGWRTRAEAATACFRRAGMYGEPGDTAWNSHLYGVLPQPFWGQIKAVYMRLQKNKCAFCERKLTVRVKDHDVEHFRPKRAVKAWPPLSTDPAFPEGYYLLAYHPLNYATTCEHCNRGLKRSYFPIAAARLSGQDDPASLQPERPLLIYPIGQKDTDPEELLGFQGIVPVPKYTDPTTHENHRARVTINFFDLQEREELRRERAEVIQTIYLALGLENAPETRRRRLARITIRQYTASGLQHTNCARCFVALYRRNPAQAERFATLAIHLLSKLVRRPSARY